MIAQYEAEWGNAAEVIFYLAVAPQLVPEITTNLHGLQLEKSKDCMRIVVENLLGTTSRAPGS